MSSPALVYADTSVFGGVFDDEFRLPSEMFMQEVRNKRYTLASSALVQEELEPAPKDIRNLFERMLPLTHLLDIDDHALSLQESYLLAGIVGVSSADDALHVAVASVNRCELIVSWNFRHIVNLDRIRLYNEVNVENGWGSLEIRSPREVVHYEDKDI